MSGKKEKKEKKSAKQDNKVTITGTVDQINYTRDDFYIGRLRVEKCDPPHPDVKLQKLISIVGKWAGVTNDRLSVIGKVSVDPKWGPQCQVTGVTLSFDMSIDGLRQYLEKNKNFPGIGPAKAKAITDAFGDKTEQVLSKEPQRLSAVAKIPQDTALKIQEQWNAEKDRNLAYTELMKFNLSLGQARKIYDAIGENAVNLVKKNPYALIDLVDRIGFLTIDKIAIENGIGKDSEYRIRACIVYSMKLNEQNGSSCIDGPTLKANVEKLLNVEDISVFKVINKCVDDLVEDAHLMVTTEGKKGTHDFQQIYARQSTFSMEREIYEFLLDHLVEANQRPIITNSATLEHIKEKIPSLNNDQAMAVAAAKTFSCVITGGAGTGKTFTIQSIIETNPGRSFALCAPTGKAARRMEESLQGSACDDIEASTIHRLLCYSPETQSFEINKFNKLEVDYLIVDEFSMVDVYLAYSLLSAIDPEHTKIIIVGDHNQLPSIGCGNILRDIINNKLLPVASLTEVMRQGGVLKECCNTVLDGKVKPTEKDDTTQWIVSRNNKDSEVFKKTLMQMFTNERFSANGFRPFEDVQIISPQRKGALGTLELNKMMQAYFQKLRDNFITPEPEGKKYKIHEGDKVIQTKNDYKLDVMNGTLGIVKEISYGDPGKFEDGSQGRKMEDANGQYYKILFETGKFLRIKKGSEKASNIELAYALTIHKVQGSEFPCVVVVCHKLHNFMHHRGLLYTAVTRAKKSVIILGDRWGVTNCAKVIKTDARKTLLPIFNKNL